MLLIYHFLVKQKCNAWPSWKQVACIDHMYIKRILSIKILSLKCLFIYIFLNFPFYFILKVLGLFNNNNNFVLKNKDVEY